MSERKIRWGIIGYARIASESVIPAILRAKNAEIAAVASRDAGKREAYRARYGVGRILSDYDALLSDPAIDAIYLPLPNSLHRPWVLAAAARGKPILCEKPLGLSAAECREMVAGCATSRVPLMEAFMYRFTERTRQVLEVIRSGQLGEIKQISSSFRFFLDRPASIKWQSALGGGSLYDVGCYPINFVGMIADAAAGSGPGSVHPVAVNAQADRVGGIDVNFTGVLKYASGLIASVHCGFNACKRVHSEIIGTQGFLEIPDTFFDNPGSLILTLGDHRTEIPVTASDRYRAEIEDFSAAILENRAPTLPLEESIRNAEVLDQLLAASLGEGGRPGRSLQT